MQALRMVGVAFLTLSRAVRAVSSARDSLCGIQSDTRSGTPAHCDGRMLLPWQNRVCNTLGWRGSPKAPMRSGAESYKTPHSVKNTSTPLCIRETDRGNLEAPSNTRCDGVNEHPNENKMVAPCELMETMRSAVVVRRHGPEPVRLRRKRTWHRPHPVDVQTPTTPFYDVPSVQTGPPARAVLL